MKREDLNVLLVSGHLAPQGLDDDVIARESRLPKPFTRMELARKMREAMGEGAEALRE